ncbi:MAG: glycine--tRNA ligase subunit alpha [Bacteroidetes bacterium]|nr:MAG: glycine--tRNA ligase subunit alpha [Bacteroidota bacterium]
MYGDIQNLETHLRKNREALKKLNSENYEIIAEGLGIRADTVESAEELKQIIQVTITNLEKQLELEKKIKNTKKETIPEMPHSKIYTEPPRQTQSAEDMADEMDALLEKEGLLNQELEITYGIERIAMFLQEVDNVFKIEWNDSWKYGDIHMESERQFSTYNFDRADVKMLRRIFDMYESECLKLLEEDLYLPAYDYCMKCSHVFNLMHARGALSVNERTSYITRIRKLANGCAKKYIQKLKGEK